MENQNEKVVQELNDLIEFSKSSKEAYDTAVQNVKNPSIKSLFTNLGKQHQQFATELEGQLRTLGGSAGRSSGGRYQTTTWATAKTAATTGNEKDVLDKFERGESEIEQKYDQILNESGLPNNVKEIIRKQHDTQRQVQNQIREMKTNAR